MSGTSNPDAGFGDGMPARNFGTVAGPFSVRSPVKLEHPGPPLSQMTNVSLRKVAADASTSGWNIQNMYDEKSSLLLSALSKTAGIKPACISPLKVLNAG